jgi:lysophospholipase L1-like esterase
VAPSETTAPSSAGVPADLSDVSEDIYDSNTKTIICEDLALFTLPLDEPVGEGDKVLVHIVGSVKADTVGFRCYLVNGGVDVACSDIYAAHEDENWVAGDFDLTFTLEAFQDADMIQFKGPQHGTNIDWLQLKLVEYGGNGGTVPEVSGAPAAQTAAAQTSAPEGFDPSEQEYTEMCEKSVVSTDNNARIKKVIDKAKSGEEVKIAFIGGSITEGALANPNSKCYAEVTANQFAQKYGKDGGSNVKFVNAGMSGTPSALGVIRYERDVIDRLGGDPDLLFIEFAVNDSGESTKSGAYEGLIRRGLQAGAAVILVFSVFQGNNTVMESQYKPIGTYYKLPMVSIGDATKDKYKLNGFNAWFYGDSLHPNNVGHTFMSDCIMTAIDKMDKDGLQEEALIPDPKKTADYENFHMISSDTEVDGELITALDKGGFDKKDTSQPTFQYKYNGKASQTWFPNCWKHSTKSSADSFTATVKCKTFMISYKLSSAKTAGKAELYVDGELKKTMNSYNGDGWNNATSDVVFNDTEVKTHNIEVKMAEGDEEKEFTIYAFGYGTGAIENK